jgi:hypothetical protein
MQPTVLCNLSALMTTVAMRLFRRMSIAGGRLLSAGPVLDSTICLVQIGAGSSRPQLAQTDTAWELRGRNCECGIEEVYRVFEVRFV